MSYATRVKDSIVSFDDRGNLIVENAVIFWTNFGGAPTRFRTQGGLRTFNLALPEDVAEGLKEDGWNIRTRAPYDDQDDPLYFTECVLNMESKFEPRVMLCTEWKEKKSMTRLHGDTVKKLDGMRFENVDLVIHPRRRDDGGCKGYCNTIVATQAKSDLFGGKYNEYEMSDSDNEQTNE